MRTSIACLAAAAVAFTPALAAAQNATAPHSLNSTEDFSYNSNPSTTGCTSWSEFDSKMNKTFVATCKSQEQFSAAFQVGEKMTSTCKQQSSDYVCSISPKRN